MNLTKHELFVLQDELQNAADAYAKQLETNTCPKTKLWTNVRLILMQEILQKAMNAERSLS